MNNFGSTVVKVVVLAGGAVAGAFLAGWVDKWISSQNQTQTDYDKMRYEQGLAPLPPQPQVEEQRG